MSKELEIQDLGLQPFAQVWELQKQCLEQRAQDLIPDRLLLVEHQAVYTIGRRKAAELEQAYATLQPRPILVERGGEITFHEPGQLVAYPIFLLQGGRRDLKSFLNGLEQVLIETLAEFGFEAERDPRNTGVWIKGLKVASIGIAVRRWVSWHGLALNINNDLSLSQQIRPCGFDPEIMTTLAHLKGGPVDSEQLKAVLIRQFQAWWLGHE